MSIQIRQDRRHSAIQRLMSTDFHKRGWYSLRSKQTHKLATELKQRDRQTLLTQGFQINKSRNLGATLLIKMQKQETLTRKTSQLCKIVIQETWIHFPAVKKSDSSIREIKMEAINNLRQLVLERIVWSHRQLKEILAETVIPCQEWAREHKTIVIASSNS